MARDDFDRIQREDVLRAIAYLRDEAPPKELTQYASRDYDLVFGGLRLPPKHVLRVAYRYANGSEMHGMSGGVDGANLYLERLGLTVVEKAANPSVGDASEVKDELVRRMELWETLTEMGPRGISPTALRDHGVYGGAQGIWRDVDTTRPVSEDAFGVTVSVLHTGKHYPDDLSKDGLLYHYPETGRTGSTDTNEIEATKNAYRLGLPIFVITTNPDDPTTRDIRLAYVEDWDQEARAFLITFADSVSDNSYGYVEDLELEVAADFQLFETSREVRYQEVVQRPNQNRFRFNLIKTHGTQCAVCSVSVPQMLQASHIVEKADGGSDDVLNGLVLCANHHQAYDSDLFAIELRSRRVVAVEGGPSLEDLRIERRDIAHLEPGPAEQALEWRWKRLQSKPRMM